MNFTEYKSVIESVWKEFSKYLPSCSFIRSKQEFISKISDSLQ